MRSTSRGPINAAVRRGEQVFTEIACASCHIPVLRIGPSANPLFNRKPVIAGSATRSTRWPS